MKFESLFDTFPLEGVETFEDKWWKKLFKFEFRGPIVLVIILTLSHVCERVGNLCFHEVYGELRDVLDVDVVCIAYHLQLLHEFLIV